MQTKATSVLPPHLAELFYQLFDNKLSFPQFTQQLYAAEAEFERYMTPDDYLELISFNYKKSYAMHDLNKLISKYINKGENEKRKLLAYLEDVKEKSAKTPLALEMLYHLHCKGYYFLEPISMGYGLVVVVPYMYNANHWEDLSKSQQEALLDSFYPDLTTEAQEMITLLENEVIVPLGEQDDRGYYLYTSH